MVYIYMLLLVVILVLIGSFLICQQRKKESFSNDDFYSFSTIEYPRYQSADLTTNRDYSYDSGHAERFVSVKDNTITVTINVKCNLFLLQDDSSHLVYVSKEGEKRFIGKLEAGSDQWSRLKYTGDQSLLGLDEVQVYLLENNKEEMLICSGTFF